MKDENDNYSDISLDVESDLGVGYSLGLAFKASDKLNLGISYRSQIDMKARDGDVKFNEVPKAFKPLLPETEFGADLPMPAELTIGVSYQVTEKLLLAFDYNYLFWSEYESLTIDFTKNSSLLQDKTMKRNYQNTSTFRIGAEYTVSKKLLVRTGAYYDMTPIRDGYLNPETPSLNSLGLTAGLTYNITKKLAIDASFLYLTGFSKDGSYDHHEEGGQTVSFGGEYKTYTAVPFLGISYKF